MAIKLKQITDNIHETIYLSNLESEFVSTPFFFRLHDIYQSSTVYMTYPANRTKRYEHSLGAMELASDLLFSSVANADRLTRSKLLSYLRGKLYQLYSESFLRGNDVSARYFIECAHVFNEISIEPLPRTKEEFENAIEKSIRELFGTPWLYDQNLERYQVASLFGEGKEYQISTYDVFLFRCLLQALRIVALFHDVGHPPYSHILEDVFKKIYNEIMSNETEKEKNSEVAKCFQQISQFLSRDGRVAFKASMILTQSALFNAEFHERVGLALLQSAINDVIPQEISKFSGSKFDDTTRLIGCLYYMAVAEFAMCMLTEEDVFFKSFHKFVDGIIDADRLDYVVRDADNSGVKWGRIPYKRVIESARLFYRENTEGVFLLAFPQKNQKDIEDFLVTRYKIFSRINFHHRSIRTSVALQSSVEYIAKDYLRAKKPQKRISQDIENLWELLDRASGKRGIDRRIIQWNDSWLITTLQRAYVDLGKKTTQTLIISWPI